MNEIIKAVSILGLTLMGSGFIIGLFDYLKSKAENSPTLKEKIEIIENIIESSVIYINQTFVDILKENDDFGNNEKYEAFNKAKKLILSQLSTDLLKVIKDIYGDMDCYIDTMIESNVNKHKTLFIVEDEIDKESISTVITESIDLNDQSNETINCANTK